MVFGFPALRNFRSAIVIAALVAALPAAALAQADPRADPKDDPRIIPPKDSRRTLPEAPAKLPKVGADRTKVSTSCSGALKAAPDQASAKHVEARIWAMWLQTPSDTAALLMSRAKAAVDAQKIRRGAETAGLAGQAPP